MPELPEVETIRRNLEQTVVGARVLGASDPTHERTLRNQQGGITGLRAGLVGARLGAAVRRGKFLWFPLLGDRPSAKGPFALMMHLGMDGVFVGSGIFKAGDPRKRARAIVRAVAHYNDPEVLAEVSEDLGEPMVGINLDQLKEEERLAKRGW